MVLVIDNYDSFTFNLVQLFGGLGAEIRVARNDRCSLEAIRAWAPTHIVISPGPCTPAEAGVSVDVVRALGASVPILGVCLGHQAIGEAYGGRTIRAGRIMHGKTAPVRHSGVGIFQGLPSPLVVTRYHSLTTDPEALPAALEPVAWSDGPGEEGEVQAMRHREHQVWGVQFHPESLFSEGGGTLIENFLRL
jgi:anthranilate synthase component 2